MLRFLGGCMGRLLTTALTVAVLVLAWYNRHEIMALADALLDNEPEVSARVADDAAARLAGLGEDGVTRVAFHAPEIQSLIVYRWAPLLPETVVRPRVALGQGRLTVEGDVATEGFGRIAELREVLPFLPDTATLRAVGSFVPLEGDYVSLEVHELGAAGIPIPSRMIPPILARFRSHELPDAGPNALVLPLPSGIGSVYVSGDSLVVSTRGGA
ncbi:MAG: hypothetical protein R3314_03215 [Longimicrobiales bacterium]|nr:hypothetical protein [Longimicrobiales bacterium]